MFKWKKKNNNPYNYFLTYVPSVKFDPFFVLKHQRHQRSGGPLSTRRQWRPAAGPGPIQDPQRQEWVTARLFCLFTILLYALNGEIVAYVCIHKTCLFFVFFIRICPQMWWCQPEDWSSCSGVLIHRCCTRGTGWASCELWKQDVLNPEMIPLLTTPVSSVCTE